VALLPRSGQGAGDSPHGSLKRDCADCHSAESWTPVKNPPKFDHKETGYPLEVAHSKLDCRSCHRSLQFDHVGTSCVDCHKDPHRGEMGARCEFCHTPRTWSNQREMFQVHARTRFPLLAVHARLDCTACHRNQKPTEFANTPSDCGTCHADTYAQARNPDHVRSGFSRRCEECHAVVAVTWRGARFTQHDRTRFPLTGGHVGVTCERCHAGGRFAGTPTQCVACHESDYQGVSNPNHVASGFSRTCDNCHRTSAWRPATFDHSSSRFPLTGAHTGLDCARCHPGNRFTGTSSQCVACHDADYRRVTNPNHITSGFPNTCDACHSTAAWRPASLNHDQTAFPLTGAHRGVGCERCHVGGRYKGTSTECFACHQADYQRTTNPSHSGGGFPTTCQSCHSTNAWKPANFNHDTSGFPLVGAHRSVDCAQCHPGGRYRGTPSDCYSCHRTDYDRTNNPNHAASGFPTNCTSCHSLNGWRPATFDHDSRNFPIYSGRHRGVWSNCTDCHAAGNTRVFSCTDCHEHSNKSEVDRDHRDVNGYNYTSTSCYRCHPRGVAEDD
jgi:nitrate/TMAO reductase-like tetraheme cytochrome c subunit